MRQVTFKDIMSFIQRTVYSVDHRLPNHGEQVAYLSWAMFWHLGFREQDLLRLVVAAMLHDIGACDPEERQKLSELELFHPLDHSISGYLLLRELSPDPETAPVILYHHSRWDHRFATAVDGIPYPDESSVIQLVDRVAILFNQSDKNLYERVERFFSQPQSEGRFDVAHILLFRQLCQETDLLDKLVSGDYFREIHGVLDTVPLQGRELAQYLHLLAALIDCRSPPSVGHTEVVLEVVRQLLAGQGISSPEELLAAETAILIRNAGRLSLPANAFPQDSDGDGGQRLIGLIRQIRQANAAIVSGLPGLEIAGFWIPDELQRLITLADVMVSLLERGMENGQAFILVNRIAAPEFFGLDDCALLAGRMATILHHVDKARNAALVRYHTILEDHRSLSQKIRQQM